MSAEENKAVIRRFYAAWNEGRVEEVFELVASTYTSHAGASEISGREGFKQLVASYQRSFSGIRHTIEDLLAAEGNKVIARVTISGIHTGNFMGIAATGKPFAVSSINILYVENGQVAEHWQVSDRMALIQQLGEPGQTGKESGY